MTRRQQPAARVSNVPAPARETDLARVRIVGDSMTGAGMFPGDIAVVDRAQKPSDRCIIMAELDGGFMIKRYRQKSNRIWMQAENPSCRDIAINEDSGFLVWGVITYWIRRNG